MTIKEKKVTRHLRDVAMNNIGAFLGNELDHTSNWYYDSPDGNECFVEFTTKDGTKWRLTLKKEEGK